MTKSSLIIALLLLSAGCATGGRNPVAVAAYESYDFPRARESLRADAYLQNDEQVLLNNLRLGSAALADGDLAESERALGRAFELLSSAGLNDDRTTAAVVFHEGVRVWKGEPFEQALAYMDVATLYAVKGDWENARAAAANALFRLTDFGKDQTMETLARRAAEDDDFLETAYTAVDTNFVLGFLMQAIASDLSGAAGSRAQFDAALAIDPQLAPLVDILRTRDYDTLLIVAYGSGPEKVSYGPDGALVRFDHRERVRGPMVVHADGTLAARIDPVCDVERLASDHRWKNLEDVRVAKSTIGELLVASGFIVASSSRNSDTELVGAALILAGLLSKAGAVADTRHFEFAPQAIYLIPLRLEEEATLSIRVDGDQAPRMVLPDVRPGTTERPRAIYSRILGGGVRPPAWATATTLQYGNDHSGVRRGDFPWILGGRDVSTPSRATLESYQANGYLTGLTPNDLRNLYAAEGILIGSGAERGVDTLKNPSYRHVLEGGTGLFTPAADSVGYKRLMYSQWPPYAPRSELALRLAAECSSGAAATLAQENDR